MNSLKTVLALTLICVLLVGCNPIERLIDDFFDGFNEGTATQGTAPTEGSDSHVLETAEELDRVIAQMSESFTVTEKVKIRSLQVWEDLDSYYDNTSGVLQVRGIKGINISYIEKADYLDVELSPQYEMYKKVIIAFKTGDFSQLTPEERLVYDAAGTIIENLVSEEADSFETARVLHDFLVHLIDYDDNHANNPNAFNVYGALLDGLAVCQGYAHAYKLLLTMTGIESMLVTGIAENAEGSEKHAWNLVNYGNDEWYHVDVTWNDQERKDSHRYFNISDSVISASHDWNREMYPAANSMRLNFFHHSGIYAESLERLEAVFESMYSESRRGYEILCGFEVSTDDLSFLFRLTGISEINFLISDYGDDKLLTVLL